MRVIKVAALLALAGCGGDQAANEAAGESNMMWPAADRGPEENLSAVAEKEAPPILDSTWTGRFAASPQECPTGAWDFGAEQGTAPGEAACAVRGIGRAAGQVTLEMECSDPGPMAAERWVLVPAPGDALAVERSRAGETVRLDLVRCR